MGRILNSHAVWLTALLLVLGAILAACAPDTSAQLISPNMVADTGGEIVVAVKEEAKTIDQLSQEEIFAGLSESMVAAITNGDPAVGEQLSALNACIGCHGLAEGQVLAGPSWYNLANVAVNRVTGVGPANYLYTSIINPNAYVVDGFVANVMPQTYAESLSEEDLGNLISYILTEQAQ